MKFWVREEHGTKSDRVIYVTAFLATKLDVQHRRRACRDNPDVFSSYDVTTNPKRAQKWIDEKKNLDNWDQGY